MSIKFTKLRKFIMARFYRDVYNQITLSSLKYNLLKDQAIVQLF